MASLTDLAGGVTIGVASPAVAGVASLVDAGVASLADLAGGVTIGVASLAVAGVVSLADAGVASMAVAGVAFLADPVGVVADGVTFRDGCGALDGSVCDCGDCCDGIDDTG